MNILTLCISFFLTGLFAIGGGLAAIPIMQQFIVDRGWIEPELFYNMIAVSESTPGPIGVNMATYIGFEHYGVLGGIATTAALTLPSFVIILIIARSYARFQDNPLVKSGLYGIRAAVCGLIASASYSVLSVTVLTPESFILAPSLFTLFDFKQLLIYAVIFALYKIFKKHPIWYIIFGAVCGIAFL
ncbi:MAG: chromate transporter [Oscillospiraceae bacterium]|nr:chromate transporter [Oscillospiraceae bacterium]